MDGPSSRRDFLRLAAGAAAVAATGVGCSSGSDKPKSGPAAGKAKNERTLRIAQWSHFVPAYDNWFDNEFAKRWGDEHDVEVVVDHIAFNELSARADTEATVGRGHDIFGFLFPAASRFEDQVIDHREIVEEAEAKVGPMQPLTKRAIFNPKTKKYFGFSDYWVANLTQYRVDLWESVGRGLRPSSYEELLKAGPQLKAMAHPLGLSMGESDPDAEASLIALMHAHGSSIQDEGANLTINRPATIEALKVMTAIFKSGMTDEVLRWDGTSNNRYLAGGTGSTILNPLSAIRAMEKQTPELAAKVGLLPMPKGPAGNQSPYVVGTYVIWKFAQDPNTAKQFLVDLVLNSREALVRSEYFNLPSFPGAVPNLRDLLATDAAAQPPGKYSLLAGADAWTTNMGHPGYANAAVDEIFNQALVTRMFAAAAKGEMSAEEAVRAAEAQMKPVFDKWRERVKI